MQKSQSVLEVLGKYFEGVKFREFTGVIRFNIEAIDDDQLQALAIISVHSACEIKVKRSGTGLLIIINL
jgi:hypothetical protein